MSMLRQHVAIQYALGLGIVNSNFVHWWMVLKQEAVEKSVGHKLK